MEIHVVEKQGYCIGVKIALERMKNIRKEHPDEDIHVLGWVVHNARVIEELNDMNIVTLDDKKKSRLELLKQIKKGIVVLTAHGTDENVKREALKMGLTVYDTTCVFVQQIEDKIKKALRDGFNVIYIGKRDHPETISALSIDESIVLVETMFDVMSLPKNKKYYAINQTTISEIDLEDIFDELERSYDVVVDNKTCTETLDRQHAVLGLIGYKYLIVVGDKRSNNSNNLVKVGKERVEEAILVESPADLDIKKLWKYKGRIALSAGASTPPYVVQEVLDEIEKVYASRNIK